MGPMAAIHKIHFKLSNKCFFLKLNSMIHRSSKFRTSKFQGYMKFKL